MLAAAFLLAAPLVAPSGAAEPLVPVPYDACVIGPGIGGSCTFHCSSGWSVHVESLDNVPALGGAFGVTATCGGVTASCAGIGFCSAHAAFTDHADDGTCTASGVVALVQCRAY